MTREEALRILERMLEDDDLDLTAEEFETVGDLLFSRPASRQVLEDMLRDVNGTHLRMDEEQAIVLLSGIELP